MNGVKARLIGLSLADLAIDVLLPTVVALGLGAAGVPLYLALTAGGVLLAAKAALGRIADWRPDRRAAGVAAAAVTALALLIGLAAAGAPDVLAAAVAGAVVAVPVVLAVAGRGRSADPLGLLVLVEVVASVAITLASDDPRFVLARPAVYTAVAGVFALVTCRWGRPVMLDATKPLATLGDPVRAAAFEAAWAGSPRFRAIERATTAGLGVVLIAEAVLRVVVVWTAVDPDAVLSALIVQVPGVLLIAVWFLAVRGIAVPHSRAIVRSYLPDAPEPAPARG